MEFFITASAVFTGTIAAHFVTGFINAQYYKYTKKKAIDALAETLSEKISQFEQATIEKEERTAKEVAIDVESVLAKVTNGGGRLN